MKRESILIVVLFVSICLQAQNISQEKACDIAARFVAQTMPIKSKGTGGKAQMLREIHQHDVLPETSGTQLYMYDIGSNGGYVVVSASGQGPEVLAYSDRGSIGGGHLPGAMRTMLMSYAAEIRAAASSPSSEMTRAASQSTAIPLHDAIAPIISCQWGEEAPYNQMCPMDPYTKTTTPTGSIATAMAQALYLLRPAGCTALDNYYITAEGIGLPALDATTFNWDIMRSSYDPNDNSDAAKEVARLMRYCGQSVKSNYSAHGTTASEVTALEALKQCFGLSDRMSLKNRSEYTSLQWDNLIYNELKDGRPVMLCGKSSDSMRAFLCDGYDGAGLYHINWGMAGQGDGYFMLSNLTGTEDHETGINTGFNRDVNAIVGMKLKPQDEQEIMSLKIYKPTYYTERTNRQSVADDFEIIVTTEYLNLNNETQYDIAWALYDEAGNELQKSIDNFTMPIQKGGRMTITSRYHLGASLPNGKYHLAPLTHQKGVNEWVRCNGDESFYVTMTITADTICHISIDNRQSNLSYEVSDLTLTGNCFVGEKISVSATVTNLGNVNAWEMNMVLDDETVGIIPLLIDEGQTTTVNADLTVETEGIHNLRMTMREYDYKLNRWVENDVCRDTVFYVMSEVCCPLSIKTQMLTPCKTVADIYYIEADTCSISTTFANNSTENYSSMVAFVARKLNADGTAADDIMERQTLLLPTKDSRQLTHTYRNMQYGATYLLIPAYKQSAQEWVIDEQNALKVTCVDPSGITEVSINEPPSATVYGIDGRPMKRGWHGIGISNGKKYIKK